MLLWLAQFFQQDAGWLRIVSYISFRAVAATLTALAIVLLINVVGIFLVIALLTLPAATAGCFTRHLWSMMVLATVLSCLFVVAGLLGSYWFNLPSGPAIVVLAGVVYVAGLAVNAWRGRNQRR